MYFIVGGLMAISILFLFLYGGNFLNLEFEKIERLNQTQITLDETKSIAYIATSATKNQTQILVDFIANQYEQFQRENNTTNKILSNQNTSLINQEIMLKNMDKAIKQNTIAIEQGNNLSMNLENLSKEHEIVTEEHDKIVIEAKNTTNYVEDELTRYGENSIAQFNKLLENQEQILKLLSNNNNNKTINSK